MMLDADINSLETKKLSLEIELNAILKAEEKDADKINELRSEILHLNKQINKKLGTKEVQNQKEIKRVKSGVDERNIKNYNAFKNKYKKISKMEVSTKNILRVIEEYFNKNNHEYKDNLVKVMSR